MFCSNNLSLKVIDFHKPQNEFFDCLVSFQYSWRGRTPKCFLVSCLGGVCITLENFLNCLTFSQTTKLIGWYPFIIHGKLEYRSGSVRRPITTFWRVIKPNLELWICQKMLSLWKSHFSMNLVKQFQELSNPIWNFEYAKKCFSLWKSHFINESC